MRTLMKASVLGMVIAVCAVAAQAGSIDPGVIIRDPVGCPGNNCVTITGTTFSFAVPSKGFGLLHFLNASGVTWTSLIITEGSVTAIYVSCTSDVFSCTVLAVGNGAKIILTAVGGLPGIPSGNSFEVILGCLNGNCPHWPGGTEFSAVANGSVPEPGTMTLLLTGVGAIFSRRRLRAKGA